MLRETFAHRGYNESGSVTKGVAITSKSHRNITSLQKKNFDHLDKFPGDTGNPFDRILHVLNKIETIPLPLYLFLLMLLAGGGAAFQPQRWLILLLFFLVDFLILFWLPKMKISYGPPQPQSFLLALLRVPFIWLPAPFNFFIQLLGTILLGIGFIYEPAQIKLTHKEIKTGLNSNQRTKFIHLGDLHLEKIGRREEKLLTQLQQSQPDFMLFTGDFLNLSYRSDPQAIQTVAAFFNQLQHIAPTYWVSGSPAVDLEKTVARIHDLTKAIDLNDASRIVHKNIELIGIQCTHQPHQDIHQLHALKQPDNPVFSILLYHSPDLIVELPPHRIHLILSGHTHGGQVRLPFLGALFTGSLYGRTLQAGEYRFDHTILYITRGIGLEGLGAPRVRFLCPPEIIEWTIYH